MTYNVSALSEGSTHFVVILSDGDSLMMFCVDDCGRIDKRSFEEQLASAVDWMNR